MILKGFYTLAYLVLYNSIKLVNSSGIEQNQDTMLEESSSTVEPKNFQDINNATQLGLNISIIEEKLNLLSATVGKMEQSMDTVMRDKIDFLEKNISLAIDQIIEEKIKNIDQTLKDKIKLIENKSKYIVQESKCNDTLPRDCKEVNECNSNLYNIMLPEYSNDSFPVLCDLKTLNGGWTIIQRRQDGSEDFYRIWTEYVKGFGNLNGEFFIGLEKLHILTTKGKPQELLIMLEDFEGTRKYARYGMFKVGNEQTDYTLTVANYSGTAGDSFTHHNGYKFSTKDRDNDEHDDKNCAKQFGGGWWYYSCYQSNLNGKYLAGQLPKFRKGEGISWNAFRGSEYSLKFVEMKIRGKQN